MEINDKVEFWLNNLKLFALNAEVHCSREEKVLKQEHIGTRQVNLAFNKLIKHMHADLNVQYENVVSKPVIIECGRQILLFTIGNNKFYTDISAIHEVIIYPTKNYSQFKVNDNLPMIAILNWYEGLVPVIQHIYYCRKSHQWINIYLYMMLVKKYMHSLLQEFIQNMKLKVIHTVMI